MEHEKKQVVKDLNELYKRQKEEMEIQQLQHFQVRSLTEHNSISICVDTFV